jgi:hypothetical protein
MSQETIDQILQRRRQAEKPEAVEEKQQDKFYSILIGEGIQENFLEIQSRDGVHTCFSYGDLMWIVYHPTDGLMLEFGGYLVAIEGRGLHPKLFTGIKQKRVAWVKEADLQMQDHKDNDTYISSITITPPKDFVDEAEADE